MRLALADLKKTIRRTHDAVYLTPYLIRPMSWPARSPR